MTVLSSYCHVTEWTDFTVKQKPFADSIEAIFYRSVQNAVIKQKTFWTALYDLFVSDYERKSVGSVYYKLRQRTIIVHKCM